MFSRLSLFYSVEVLCIEIGPNNDKLIINRDESDLERMKPNSITLVSKPNIKVR